MAAEPPKKNSRLNLEDRRQGRKKRKSSLTNRTGRLSGTHFSGKRNMVALVNKERRGNIDEPQDEGGSLPCGLSKYETYLA